MLITFPLVFFLVDLVLGLNFRRYSWCVFRKHISNIFICCFYKQVYERFSSLAVNPKLHYPSSKLGHFGNISGCIQSLLRGNKFVKLGLFSLIFAPKLAKKRPKPPLKLGSKCTKIHRAYLQPNLTRQKHTRFI